MRTLYPSYFDEEAVKNGGGSARSSGCGGGIAVGYGISWCGASHGTAEIDMIEKYMACEAIEKDMTCGPCQDRTFAIAISRTVDYGIGCVNGQTYWDCTGRSRDERAGFGS